MRVPLNVNFPSYYYEEKAFQSDIIVGYINQIVKEVSFHNFKVKKIIVINCQIFFSLALFF